MLTRVHINTLTNTLDIRPLQQKKSGTIFLFRQIFIKTVSLLSNSFLQTPSFVLGHASLIRRAIIFKKDEFF